MPSAQGPSPEGRALPRARSRPPEPLPHQAADVPNILAATTQRCFARPPRAGEPPPRARPPENRTPPRCDPAAAPRGGAARARRQPARGDLSCLQRLTWALPPLAPVSATFRHRSRPFCRNELHGPLREVRRRAEAPGARPCARRGRRRACHSFCSLEPDTRPLPRAPRTLCVMRPLRLEKIGEGACLHAERRAAGQSARGMPRSTWPQQRAVEQLLCARPAPTRSQLCSDGLPSSPPPAPSTGTYGKVYKARDRHTGQLGTFCARCRRESEPLRQRANAAAVACIACPPSTRPCRDLSPNHGKLGLHDLVRPSPARLAPRRSHSVCRGAAPFQLR